MLPGLIQIRQYQRSWLRGDNPRRRTGSVDPLCRMRPPRGPGAPREDSPLIVGRPLLWPQTWDAAPSATADSAAAWAAATAAAAWSAATFSAVAALSILTAGVVPAALTTALARSPSPCLVGTYPLAVPPPGRLEKSQNRRESRQWGRAVSLRCCAIPKDVDRDRKRIN
jgi:hypothetical protein